MRFGVKSGTVITVGALLLAGCFADVTAPPKVEARAVWLHRFEYTSTTSTFDADSIRAYIAGTIARADSANLNMIIFQVRGSADAYYRPGLEPWGELLTGTVGADPGWDPLDFALKVAHSRGLELHAWMNTFPAWRGTQPPELTAPPAPLYLHPDWLVADSSGKPMALNSGYVSFSPGIPAVRRHIIAVASDIVSRYDVDGIHFDYIRYPESAPTLGYSHDSISVQRFNSPKGNPFNLDWDDWQREQITEFIAEAYNAITALRPAVKVSAAVIGSYRDSGWNAYNVVYQDPRRWTELGKIDFVMPMIYWPRNHPTQPFMVRANEWSDHFTLDRLVFPGIASYRYNTQDAGMTWAEAEGQIDDIRASGLRGMAFFDARSLALHWRDLAAGRFSRPALLPPVTWTDSLPPGAPKIQHLRMAGPSIYLQWSSPDEEDIARFAVYGSRTLPLLGTGDNLITVTTGAKLSLNTDVPWRKGFVAVSAIDAAWNEGPLSQPVEVVDRRGSTFTYNRKDMDP